MPIQGDVTQFAIEWSISAKLPAKQWIFGHFCFLVNTIRIGNYEEEIILSTAISYIQKFLKRTTERSIPALNGHSKEEIFQYIYDTAIFAMRPGETNEDASRRWEREIPASRQTDFTLHHFLRFVFHMTEFSEEVFKDYSMILFHDFVYNLERFVWRDINTWQTFEFDMPLFTVENVLQGFVENYSDYIKQSYDSIPDFTKEPVMPPSL